MELADRQGLHRAADRFTGVGDERIERTSDGERLIEAGLISDVEEQAFRRVDVVQGFGPPAVAMTL